MTSLPNSESQTSTDNKDFPVAKVKQSSTSLLWASKMWWITLLCLILAAWLTYTALPPKGLMISIAFPQGHGLKPGDAVRYRGIDVGRVTDVGLNANLSEVNVQVTLNANEGNLCCEGSRFWIVRPRLSLTEVQGLETAVGAKYIGVSPGDLSGPKLSTFQGLAVAPADELNRNGLQVVLRSDDTYGISAGAPVTWRGVKTGRVLSVNLSPDARHVHTTISIDRNYRKLINKTSKFWTTSGFDVDVGLSGVKLNATSLSSILNGGVSFSTLAETTPDDSIRDGHVFQLQKKADSSWLQTDAAVPLVNFELPETVLVTGQYRTSIFGISRTKSFSQQGVLANDGSQTVVLTASFPPAAIHSEAFKLRMIQPGKPAQNLAVDSLLQTTTDSGLAAVPTNATAAIKLVDLQPLTAPEDCLLFRSAVIDGKPTPLIQTVDLEHVAFQANRWVLQDDQINFSEWQGAPVLGMSTGKVVGILAIVDGQAQIAVPQSLQAPVIAVPSH